jgi:hypothetical protein
MDPSAYMLFGIALLSIILGFIALLSQKIYLDPMTKQPTEVDIPFLGKLKSNYPALVFAFLGAALAFYAFQKSYPPPNVEWTLKGRFTHPDGRPVDTSGTLSLIPVAARNKIDPHGVYEVTVFVPKGKSIESVFEALDYSYSDGRAQIDLKKEYSAWRNNKQASKIKDATEHQRIFKDVPVTVYQ